MISRPIHRRALARYFLYLLKTEYQVVNHAKNGRSTKSFMDEGRLKAIEEKIGAGDFLFIQFGHNDEKKEDPTRYTEPFSTYMENLETFIRVARDHSAYPVLITPLERRCFMDEKHLGIGAHSDYVAAMKQTAEKNQCSSGGSLQHEPYGAKEEPERKTAEDGTCSSRRASTKIIRRNPRIIPTFVMTVL